MQQNIAEVDADIDAMLLDEEQKNDEQVKAGQEKAAETADADQFRDELLEDTRKNFIT